MRVRVLLVLAIVACGRFGSDDSATRGEEPAPNARDGGADDGAAADGSIAGAHDPAAYEAAVLDDEPLAYWRCQTKSDGATPDRLVAHPAMIPDPGPSVESDSPFPSGGGSCKFTGSDQEIATVPSLPFPENAVYTVEAWFRLTQTADGVYRHLFEHSNQAQDSYGVFFHSDDDTGPELRAEEFREGHHVLVHAPVPALNVWHHVVATSGPRTAGSDVASAPVLWLDGDRVGQVLIAEDEEGEYDVPFAFGAKEDGAGAIFGSMTEVAVYGAVLPEARIKAHYALGRP